MTPTAIDAPNARIFDLAALPNAKPLCCEVLAIISDEYFLSG
jgi:hypothetical protein